MRMVAIILILVACIACRDSSRKDLPPELFPIRQAVALYCNVDHAFYEKSENVIVIMAESRWTDQNYLIILKKGATDVIAVYHKIDPLDEFYNIRGKTRDNWKVFFEGFTFHLDHASWDQIKVQIDSLVEASTNENFKTGIADGTIFAVFHNGQTTVVNNGLMFDKFQSFSNDILKTYIDPIEKLRVPLGPK